MSSEDDTDLNETVIEKELQQKHKVEKGAVNIKNRSKSSSTSSRASNSSVNETNYSVLFWLKGDEKEESKKRKKDSPEFQGRETKKQNIVCEQTKMADNKEDDIKSFSELMKYLRKKEEKDAIEKEKREIEEKERWEKLYKDNEEARNRLARVEEKLNKELCKMKQDIKELKDSKVQTNLIVQKNERKIEEIENKLKNLQKEFHEEIEESKKEEYKNPRTMRKNEEKTEHRKRENQQRIKMGLGKAEREKKKKNIIISGLEIQDKETLRKWIEEKLGTKVTIRKIWKVKKIEKAIGAQLDSVDQKIEIMKTKNKLKHERAKIFINNDTTWFERQSRKEILRKAEELENEGVKVKISHNKITAEKEEWYWNEKYEKWFRKSKQDSME